MKVEGRAIVICRIAALIDVVSLSLFRSTSGEEGRSRSTARSKRRMSPRMLHCDQLDGSSSTYVTILVRVLRPTRTGTAE